MKIRIYKDKEQFKKNNMKTYTITYQTIAESLSNVKHQAEVKAISELSAQMYFYAHNPSLIVVSVQPKELINN
jgi:hypothetical protein